MARKHGPWQIKATHQRFQDKLIEVFEDDVTKPDGEASTYATIKIKDGVKVLAIDDDEFAYFAKEFRYALGRETIEAVGGAIDEGEPLTHAAKRELHEELGIEAAEFIELGPLHHTTSLIKHTTSLFLARKLRFTKKDPDSGEIIETVKMKFDEAVRQALDGTLDNATTCLLILRAQHHLQQKQS